MDPWSNRGRGRPHNRFIEYNPNDEYEDERRSRARSQAPSRHSRAKSRGRSQAPSRAKSRGRSQTPSRAKSRGRSQAPSRTPSQYPQGQGMMVDGGRRQRTFAPLNEQQAGQGPKSHYSRQSRNPGNDQPSGYKLLNDSYHVKNYAKSGGQVIQQGRQGAPSNVKSVGSKRFGDGLGPKSRIGNPLFDTETLTGSAGALQRSKSRSRASGNASGSYRTANTNANSQSVYPNSNGMSQLSQSMNGMTIQNDDGSRTYRYEASYTVPAGDNGAEEDRERALRLYRARQVAAYYANYAYPYYNPYYYRRLW